MKKLRYGSRVLCPLFSLSLLLISCGNANRQSAVEQSETEIMQESIEETSSPAVKPTPASEPVSAQEQEEVIDNTQANAEKFYQVAEESYGLSYEQAQGWFDTVMEDDIFIGGLREISGLLFDDIDGNGETDMVIRVQETGMKYMYGTGALYFYMNEEKTYCFEDEKFPYFGDTYIRYADLNGDGSVEVVYETQGTGVGAVGDWHMAVFSCKGNTMERLEIPSDLDVDYDVGIEINVIMEAEPDTYTAYCPYFDESITFQASNAWEGDRQKEYLEQAPIEVGRNSRGYCFFQVVTWEDRNALQVGEYLSGEGGTMHWVGWAYFILVWDEQGNGSVADWWVEGELQDER